MEVFAFLFKNPEPSYYLRQMDKTAKYRITSVDILRGIVMIIMALDHTRDFFHTTAFTDDPLNIETTTVPLFFTRFITHYCAPAFIFLAGLSAFISSRNKVPGEAGLFLIKRGLWLVLIEVTIVTFSFTFNPFYNIFILQVIWATGWSMVILGLLMRLPHTAIFIIGVALFFGHDIFDYLTLPPDGFAGNTLKVLFTAQGTVLPVTKTHVLFVFYTILPWTGVMLMGFSTGKWFVKDFDIARRRRLLLYTGFALTALFILFRFFNIYGDPAPWDNKHFLSFLKVSKYPPSLLYLCVTLGPSLIALSLLENVKTWWSDIAVVYGRVPFFYYVLHFYLIHSLLVIVFFASGHTASQIADPEVPFLFRPATFGYGLPVVYLIWISIVTILYKPCKWFDGYKKTHTQWWLKYL